MNSKQLVIAALAVLTILATACAPQAAPTVAPTIQAPAATQAPATQGAAAPSGPAMVNLAKNDKLGSFLADDKGMTLYLFTNDTPNTPTCYSKCATFWPPLLTSGNAVAGT